MPELRRAAAPVAEDAVAQPCEPPGRACVRTIGRMPQAILHRRDVEGIGRRRWTKAHRQQAGTATTAAASLDRGTHLVETGSSGGNAAALWCGNWAEPRAWSRRAGSGVDGISFTVHPLSDQAHTAQILNQCSLTWSFSWLQAWIVRRLCSRAPAVSPPASRASAAAGDSNKAALGRC